MLPILFLINTLFAEPKLNFLPDPADKAPAPEVSLDISIESPQEPVLAPPPMLFCQAGGINVVQKNCRLPETLKDRAVSPNETSSSYADQMLRKHSKGFH